MDLQAVKVCPSLMASALYYELKLSVHNFTVYNLSKKHSTCYLLVRWNPIRFASYWLHQKEDKPVIIYSEGSTYQNRNKTMANARLHLAKELKIKITQKFLIKGHTQMECGGTQLLTAIACVYYSMCLMPLLIIKSTLMII